MRRRKTLVETAASFEHAQEFLGAGFEHDPVSNCVEGLVLDGGFPAVARVGDLGFGTFLHHLLPGAGGAGRIAGFPIDAGELEAEGWMLFAFVLGVDEAVGFLAVGGGEGFLFAGMGVFAVVEAPAPAERAVTILHVRVHVMSMNPLADAALTSSGPVRHGIGRYAQVAKPLKNPLKLVLPDFINSCGPSSKSWRRGSESNRRHHSNSV